MDAVMEFLSLIWIHRVEILAGLGAVISAATAAVVALRALVRVLEGAVRAFESFAITTAPHWDDEAGRWLSRALWWVADRLDSVALGLEWVSQRFGRLSLILPRRRQQ